MNKPSFRERIDREMEDVTLSPEIIRRIHNRTDRGKGRRADAVRHAPSRLPAALLSLALAACAALAVLNRGALLRPAGRGNGPSPLSPAAADLVSGRSTEAPAPSFEAAGVCFGLEEAAVREGTLTLRWTITSRRAEGDMALCALRRFEVQDAEESLTLPGAENNLTGLAGLTALGGTLAGQALPASRSCGLQLPVNPRAGTLRVRLVMEVYAPAAPPCPEAEEALSPTAAAETLAPAPPLRETPHPLNVSGDIAPQEGARYDACLDALKEGRLMLQGDGSLSPLYISVMDAEINGPADLWSGWDDASLDLAESCGIILPLGRVEIEFDVEPE